MNSSYTAKWSQHTKRANKISLNSPLATPPPPGTAAAAALRPPPQDPPQGSNGPDAQQSQAGPSAQLQQQGASDAAVTEGTTLGSDPAAGVAGPPVASSSSSSSSVATPAAGVTPLGTPTQQPSKRKTRPSAASTSAAPSSSKRSRRPNTDPSAIADKYAPPSSCLADLGGIASSIEKILELIAMPLCHPEIYAHTGVKPPRGVLLHGPPGCGKTMLAGAVAGDLGLPFLSISAPSIVSGTSGESEATLRQTFEEAARIAPAILFIDEIDAITPKRETAAREMERRIVAQLLTCLDDLSWDKTGGKPVMVIGATNRPDAIDAALRRAGRFDHEIALGVPDEEAREQILRVLAKKMRLSGDFDFRALAKATPGYVGADLTALTSAAGILAVKRIFSELGDRVDDIEDKVRTATDVGTNDGSGTVRAVEDVTSTPAVSVPGSPSVATANSNDVDMLEGGSGETTGTPASTANEQAEGPSSAPTPAADVEVDSASKVGRHAHISSRFFSSLPAHLARSSIASFLLSHPSPLTEAELAPLSITNADFLAALPSVQPSSKREGFATVPDVSWSDVGALHSTREELCMAIVEPIRRPELFAAMGVQASSGVLLWGPPGCGKTLLAKAVANESRANFISVKGPELLNKYVGESERAVRQVFSRARTSSPCVIFFDELDALVPRRDDNLSESSARVVNTLLTELDGLEARGQVYVIAATNRPDMIDPAMCRPGRLDKLLYVDLPSREERLEILRTITKKMPLLHADAGSATPTAQAVDLEALAADEHTDGFSGADLANLAREAAVVALRGALTTSRAGAGADGAFAAEGTFTQPEDQQQYAVRITHADFLAALSKVSPSVSVAQRAKYAQLRTRLSGSAAAVPADVEREGGAHGGLSMRRRKPRHARRAKSAAEGDGDGDGDVDLDANAGIDLGSDADEEQPGGAQASGTGAGADGDAEMEAGVRS